MPKKCLNINQDTRKVTIKDLIRKDFTQKEVDLANTGKFPRKELRNLENIKNTIENVEAVNKTEYELSKVLYGGTDNSDYEKAIKPQTTRPGKKKFGTKKDLYSALSLVGFASFAVFGLPFMSQFASSGLYFTYMSALGQAETPLLSFLLIQTSDDGEETVLDSFREKIQEVITPEILKTYKEALLIQKINGKAIQEHALLAENLKNLVHNAREVSAEASSLFSREEVEVNKDAVLFLISTLFGSESPSGTNFSELLKLSREKAEGNILKKAMKVKGDRGIVERAKKGIKEKRVGIKEQKAIDERVSSIVSGILIKFKDSKNKINPFTDENIREYLGETGNETMMSDMIADSIDMINTNLLDTFNRMIEDHAKKVERSYYNMRSIMNILQAGRRHVKQVGDNGGMATIPKEYHGDVLGNRKHLEAIVKMISGSGGLQERLQGVNYVIRDFVHDTDKTYAINYKYSLDKMNIGLMPISDGKGKVAFHSYGNVYAAIDKEGSFIADEKGKRDFLDSSLVNNFVEELYIERDGDNYERIEKRLAVADNIISDGELKDEEKTALLAENLQSIDYSFLTGDTKKILPFNSMVTNDKVSINEKITYKKFLTYSLSKIESENIKELSDKLKEMGVPDYKKEAIALLNRLTSPRVRAYKELTLEEVIETSLKRGNITKEEVRSILGMFGDFSNRVTKFLKKQGINTMEGKLFNAENIINEEDIKRILNTSSLIRKDIISKQDVIVKDGKRYSLFQRITDTASSEIDIKGLINQTKAFPTYSENGEERFGVDSTSPLKIYLSINTVDGPIPLITIEKPSDMKPLEGGRYIENVSLVPVHVDFGSRFETLYMNRNGESITNEKDGKVYYIDSKGNVQGEEKETGSINMEGFETIADYFDKSIKEVRRVRTGVKTGNVQVFRVEENNAHILESTKRDVSIEVNNFKNKIKKYLDDNNIKDTDINDLMSLFINPRLHEANIANLLSKQDNPNSSIVKSMKKTENESFHFNVRREEGEAAVATVNPVSASLSKSTPSYEYDMSLVKSYTEKSSGKEKAGKGYSSNEMWHKNNNNLPNYLQSIINAQESRKKDLLTRLFLKRVKEEEEGVLWNDEIKGDIDKKVHILNLSGSASGMDQQIEKKERDIEKIDNKIIDAKQKEASSKNKVQSKVIDKIPAKKATITLGVEGSDQTIKVDVTFDRGQPWEVEAQSRDLAESLYYNGKLLTTAIALGETGIKIGEEKKRVPTNISNFYIIPKGSQLVVDGQQEDLHLTGTSKIRITSMGESSLLKVEYNEEGKKKYRETPAGKTTSSTELEDISKLNDEDIFNVIDSFPNVDKLMSETEGDSLEDTDRRGFLESIGQSSRSLNELQRKLKSKTVSKVKKDYNPQVQLLTKRLSERGIESEVGKYMGEGGSVTGLLRYVGGELKTFYKEIENYELFKKLTKKEKDMISEELSETIHGLIKSVDLSTEEIKSIFRKRKGDTKVVEFLRILKNKIPADFKRGKDGLNQKIDIIEGVFKSSKNLKRSLEGALDVYSLAIEGVGRDKAVSNKAKEAALEYVRGPLLGKSRADQLQAISLRMKDSDISTSIEKTMGVLISTMEALASKQKEIISKYSGLLAIYKETLKELDKNYKRKTERAEKKKILAKYMKDRKDRELLEKEKEGLIEKKTLYEYIKNQIDVTDDSSGNTKNFASLIAVNQAESSGKSSLETDSIYMTKGLLKYLGLKGVKEEKGKIAKFIDTSMPSMVSKGGMEAVKQLVIKLIGYTIKYGFSLPDTVVENIIQASLEHIQHYVSDKTVKNSVDLKSVFNGSGIQKERQDKILKDLIEIMNVNLEPMLEKDEMKGASKERKKFGEGMGLAALAHDTMTGTSRYGGKKGYNGKKQYIEGTSKMREVAQKYFDFVDKANLTRVPGEVISERQQQYAKNVFTKNVALTSLSEIKKPADIKEFYAFATKNKKKITIGEEEIDITVDFLNEAKDDTGIKREIYERYYTSFLMEKMMTETDWARAARIEAAAIRTSGGRLSFSRKTPLEETIGGLTELDASTRAIAYIIAYIEEITAMSNIMEMFINKREDLTPKEKARLSSGIWKWLLRAIMKVLAGYLLDKAIHKSFELAKTGQKPYVDIYNRSLSAGMNINNILPHTQWVQHNAFIESAFGKENKGVGEKRYFGVRESIAQQLMPGFNAIAPSAVMQTLNLLATPITMINGVREIKKGGIGDNYDGSKITGSFLDYFVRDLKLTRFVEQIPSSFTERPTIKINGEDVTLGHSKFFKFTLFGKNPVEGMSYEELLEKSFSDKKKDLQNKINKLNRDLRDGKILQRIRDEKVAELAGTAEAAGIGKLDENSYGGKSPAKTGSSIVASRISRSRGARTRTVRIRRGLPRTRS